MKRCFTHPFFEGPDCAELLDAHPMDPVVTDKDLGAAHESKTASTLLCGWQANCVFGDRASDGNPVRQVIAETGAEAVIPPHPCRKRPADFDAFLYKARHAIDNGFAKRKQFRSLATRYDKTARKVAAQVAIVCIVVWLRL